MTVPSVTPEIPDHEALVNAQLRPVIAALLSDAEQVAAQILEEAQAQVAAVLGDARRRSEELLAAARAEGAAAARRRASRFVADARRQARETTLAAQREVYERVRSLALAQLGGLGGSPAAKELNARLETTARDLLGPDATVEVARTGVGVIATRGQRRLDLSGAALVERELAGLGPRIAEVWS